MTTKTTKKPAARATETQKAPPSNVKAHRVALPIVIALIAFCLAALGLLALREGSNDTDQITPSAIPDTGSAYQDLRGIDVERDYAIRVIITPTDDDGEGYTEIDHDGNIYFTYQDADGRQQQILYGDATYQFNTASSEWELFSESPSLDELSFADVHNLDAFSRLREDQVADGGTTRCDGGTCRVFIITDNDGGTSELQIDEESGTLVAWNQAKVLGASVDVHLEYGQDIVVDAPDSPALLPDGPEVVF